MADNINPEHYKRLTPEPILVIENWRLPFHLGCAVKYISRWDMKGGLEDLEKAKWYLERFINYARQNSRAVTGDATETGTTWPHQSSSPGKP